MAHEADVVVQPAVDVKAQYQSELLAETFTHGATLAEWMTRLEKSRMTDPRWVAIAKTHFQEGVSAVRRAVMGEKSTF